MSGENSLAAAEHAKLFRETMHRFGWVARSRQDRNYPCSVCNLRKNGEHRTHGVDLLFTFKCPYTERERGIYVDAKRYALDSVTSVAALKKWLDEGKKTTVHLDKSQKLFRASLGLSAELMIDTGIIAWDCHQSWNEQAAKKMLDQIAFFGSDKPPVSMLLFTRTHLDRIKTVHEFKEKNAHLEFLYIIAGMAKWTPILTPELIASNWWPIKFRRATADKWEIGIVGFPSSDISDVRFLLPLLSHLQLTTHHEIQIFLPKGSTDLIEDQALLNAELRATGSAMKLQCKSLPTSEYKS